MHLKKTAAALACLALCLAPAAAEEVKAYKLTIDGVAVQIDDGESLDVTLPDGRQAKVKLERNEFAPFGGRLFSFVHPSAMPVSKTDLASDITQYLMASALGTIVIVQEYDALNPVSLNQLMLQEMTKVSVQAGAKLVQQPATRKLSDGTELTGLRATVKTRTDSTVYEIFSYGGDDRGVMFVTRIADENVKAEGPLIDKFWETLRLKL